MRRVCADLGHRYGFQPPEDNPDGLPITHLEYRPAGAGIPRIVLVRTSIPDERQSDIDDPDKWARVRAFRAEVASEVRAAEFSDLQGLIQGLSTGFRPSWAFYTDMRRVNESVAGGLPRGVVLFEGTGLAVAEGDVEGGRGVGEVLLFRGADDGGGYDRVA